MDSPEQLKACAEELRKIGEIGRLAAETVEQVRYMHNHLRDEVKYARAELQPYVENGKKWKRRAYYWKERWARKCNELEGKVRDNSDYIRDRQVESLLLEIAELKKRLKKR